MEQKSSSEEAAEEALSDTSAPELFLEQAEGEEDTLIAQLIAFQDANEELCALLQNARDDYNIATGTMGEGIPRTDYYCTRDQVYVLAILFLLPRKHI